MNIFTRDNTNDGVGWDTRVSLLKQSAIYGYTQLFANFTGEIMPTLGTFGNSGGTGGLFVQDARWPVRYQNTLLTGDWGRSEVYRHELIANGPTFDLKQDVSTETEIRIVVPKADPSNPDHIGNMSLDAASARALVRSGDPKNGEAVFKSQSCIACHTIADGQTPRGPHLFEIGKRYKSAELVESVLKPGAKLAQGYETWQFVMVDGLVFQGFVVSERADVTVIRELDGQRCEIRKSEVEERLIQKLSAMPEGLASNLTPEQLTDLIAYLQSLK